MMKDSGPKNAKSVQYLRAKSARISMQVYLFCLLYYTGNLQQQIDPQCTKCKWSKINKKNQIFFHIDVMILKIEAMKKKC